MTTESVRVDTYAPTVALRINGAPITPAAGASIRSIEVQQAINKAGLVSLVVQDELRAGQFAWLGNALFKYGNEVSVALGYLGDNAVVATGKIQNIIAQFPEHAHPTFTVEGTDTAFRKLTVPSGMQVFKQQSTADIVRKIASLAGVSAEVDVPSDKIALKTKRGGQSFFDFLKDLTREGHYEVQYAGGTLRFSAPLQDREAQMTLEWGKNLISFKPTLNTSQAVSAVVVRGWDKHGKKPIEVRVSAGEETIQERRARFSSQIAQDIFGEVVKEITDRPVNSVQDARKIAKAELDRIAGNLVRGSATTVGLPKLRPGVCVQLDGLGTWFSGKYYVEKVTHHLDAAGYRTTFEGRRNAL